jgi:ABC-2 type transport system permease protein
LIAMFFTALGTAFGSIIQDMQAFPLVMNFVSMPLFFFSGALFPISGLSRILQLLMRLNPLTYGVDGLRGALTQRFIFGAGADIALMSVSAIILLGVGSYLFSKIQI